MKKQRTERIKLNIQGKVQGVFFRSSTKTKAKELNLTGYVQNQTDGSVTLVAEGPENDLKQLIERCYNGPTGAKVSRVEKEWQEASGEFDKFEIKY